MTVAFAAREARALALGEPEVRSALAEALDLRIPVTIGKGESIEPACFTLARDPTTAIPRLTAARISLERSATGTYLRVRTEGPVNEPALMLGVVASCPGQFAQVQRDYTLLVDPRTSTEAPAARAAPQPAFAGTPASAPSAPATIPSIAATLIARIGDTLESIANAIFPRNRAAKKSYIAALRESNPPLATLGDGDPIPVDTPIALPDLRTFARARPPSGPRTPPPSQGAFAPIERSASEPRVPQVESAPRSSPPAAARRPPREAKAITKAREPAPGPGAEIQPTPRLESRIEKAPAPVRSSPSPGFVLKLSSPQIDLGPSRTIDDRGRAQLRDRQLVLDADDQVAAVLALRNSVRQLETRVAELQLKLAGMPSSFPAPRAAEVPAAAAPAATPLAPAPVVPAPPPSPAPPSKAAAAQEPVAPPVTTSAPPPSPAAEPAATAAAPADKVEPPVIAETPRAAPAKKAAEPAAAIDWRYYGLWALAALLILAAILLALRLARRRREAEYAYEYSVPPDEDQIVVADEPLREDPVFSHELEPEVAGPARRELDADVDIATRLDGDTDDLRRRYIEERFPEIGKGAISLEDPDSVVKGARLFYEDRAVARAVELLHYAIERHPGEVKTWLALFEIFRLERLAGEFAELARRFRERHGKSDYWRKVQYFGREIDPGNALYAESPVNTFETIGPSQAKRLAADNAFDPVAENWLGAPMDFQNEVLANELRMTLMAEARISEQDLVPNPMPALRNVEMFNVA